MKECNFIGKLPYPLGDMPGLVKENYLYIFGGGSNQDLKDEILRVNDAGRTEVVGKIPVQVRGHQVVEVGNSIYMLGGFTGATTAQVFRLNIEEGRAEEVSPMPHDAAWFTATVVDNKIVVVGGFSIPDGYWKHIAVYDPLKDQWKKIDNAFPRLIFKRERLGSNTAVTLGRTIYSFGGADIFDSERMRANALATSATLDLEKKTWEPFKATFQAREGLVSAIYGNTVLLVGGMQENPEEPSAAIDRVDMNTGQTTPYARLQIARVAPAVGVVGKRLLIAGGVTKPIFDMTDTIEAVDIE